MLDSWSKIVNQLDELAALIRHNDSHRLALQSAETRDELLAILMDIAGSEGLYIEEAVLEAAILAAESPQDQV